MRRFAVALWNAENMLVDKAHQDLPKRVDLTAFVNAEGLHHKSDKIHFGAAACRELVKLLGSSVFRDHPGMTQ
ncbi:MAG: Carbohydrate acetyl esterase/feruloyl esterase precursor [Verrucomicrobiota bacterium]|jgi:hypothetical protein